MLSDYSGNKLKINNKMTYGNPQISEILKHTSE